MPESLYLGRRQDAQASLPTKAAPPAKRCFASSLARRLLPLSAARAYAPNAQPARRAQAGRSRRARQPPMHAHGASPAPLALLAARVRGAPARRRAVAARVGATSRVALARNRFGAQVISHAGHATPGQARERPGGHTASARVPCTGKELRRRCSCSSPPLLAARRASAPRWLRAMGRLREWRWRGANAVRLSYQRRQRRPCGGVSNQASRAGFSRSAPRWRARRTRSRSPARDRMAMAEIRESGKPFDCVTFCGAIQARRVR
jgi:hypothetical protein